MRYVLLAATALLAATPAMAQSNGGNNGDTNINAFVRQQPGTPPVSNGIPVIVDNREGQPVIEYQGTPTRGFEDGGIPVIVGNREGQPVIRYTDSGDQRLPGSSLVR